MKKIIILIILLWCGSLNTKAQSVPDSATGWSLQDVYDAVHYWAIVIDYPMTADLQSCFDAADYVAANYADNYDSYWYTYYYSLYGAKNMLMFRNYAGGASVPTVTTASITSITETTASGGGNVTAGGGSPVSARGVCWSTSANPTISNSKTTDGTGTGSFTSSLTSLSAGTLYHVRAYATNGSGTSYGSDVTFTTESACTTRPAGLPCFALVSQYYSGGSWHYLTGSEANACTALYEHVTNGATLSGGAGYQGAKTQYSPIYYDCNATDCNVATFIPDGFYLIEHASLNDPIYQIIGGVIVGITNCPQ